MVSTTTGKYISELFNAKKFACAPVEPHWFYKKTETENLMWHPFSMLDSVRLEDACKSMDGAHAVVPVPSDGGRYDVYVFERIRKAVYWDENPSPVMRCTWFYKSHEDDPYIPCPEEVATKLEEQYMECFCNTKYSRTVEWKCEVMALNNHELYLDLSSLPDVTGGNHDSNQLPWKLRRGIDDTVFIEDGETLQVDHLIFVVHGVGSYCDLRFRPLVECGNLILFDILSHQLRNCDTCLHTSSQGFLSRGKHKECPIILQNKMHSKDDNHNLATNRESKQCEHDIPQFKDHSHIPKKSNVMDCFPSTSGSDEPWKPRLSFTSVSYTIGPHGTGQPTIKYPMLDFQPSIFFALGSPVGMFLAVRGIETISERYCLPTCPGFFNIFHPYDAVAYRMEPLIDSSFSLDPVLIPYYRGRRRMHLELKQHLEEIGSEMTKAFRNMYSILDSDDNIDEELTNSYEKYDSDISPEENVKIGSLNGGRRIDYVLQEKPIESLNEYVFAIGSHFCYWESEDVVLLILKEIYALQDISPLRKPAEDLD